MTTTETYKVDFFLADRNELVVHLGVPREEITPDKATIPAVVCYLGVPYTILFSVRNPRVVDLRKNGLGLDDRLEKNKALKKLLDSAVVALVGRILSEREEAG